MPAIRAETVYVPSPFVIASRLAPVATLVTVIVTPGRTAPASSATRPVMLAVVWAQVGWLARKIKRNAGMLQMLSLFAISHSFVAHHFVFAPAALSPQPNWAHVSDRVDGRQYVN